LIYTGKSIVLSVRFAYISYQRCIMKVTAINGSPHKEGNTYHALARIGSILKENDIDFEIVHIGNKAIRGCTACGECFKRADGTCVFGDDVVNETVQTMKNSDGIILSSPVYYSGVAGTMKSFLDRAFFVAGASGGLFRHKVGAALVAVRRSGGSSTLDCLNHYLSYTEMIIASSNYWNIIHGRAAGEVLKDDEGMQALDVLAKNMVWILKMKEATKDTIVPPQKAEKVYTSFIR
jgi:multimeric flavodoxin WrbA